MKGKPTTFWAKLDRNQDGQVVAWHSLLAHSADVAAVFEALLQHTILNRRIAAALGQKELSDIQIARLSVLAALHDAGKTNRGFQARVDRKAKLKAGHVGPMIAVIESSYQDEVLGALGLAEMLSWFVDDVAFIEILCATWAHHGEPLRLKSAAAKYIDSRLWEDAEPDSPIKGLLALQEALKQWFPEAFGDGGEPFPRTPVFQHIFNGALTLADWMGSNKQDQFFPYATSLDDRMGFARERAYRLLRTMHLAPTETRKVLADEKVSFEKISGFSTPYEIQTKCRDLSISDKGNLTILESDTGSGKTEAAVARFIKLFQKGAVDGMYFAVPTRSAATQLYDRIDKALINVFGESRPPAVLAIPGYIRVDQLDGDPNALPGFDVQWPDDRPALAVRGWAAESPKRYLAAAVAVGTVDQVMMSSLEVRHAHLRAAALSRQFLVIDEVHSSDPYMRRILEKVLDHHLEVGGHAMLMSATLGTTDRLGYAQAGRASAMSVEEAAAQPYPLLTHVSGDRREPIQISGNSSDYEKTVDISVVPCASEPERIANRAIKYAEQGARVLIIRNLVADCVATQKALENLANSALLFCPHGNISTPHHSRFAASDRRKLDRAIEDYFGKQSDREAVIAVATQTVEQSLDIDADILLTDLCPTDVLLQRIGRLQRHSGRQRPPGFDVARAEVLVPPSRALSEHIADSGELAGSGIKGKHGLGTVYRDLRMLEATWRQLEEDEQWVIPDDNRRLVERTTHPARLGQICAELGGLWEEHERFILGERLGQQGHGDLVSIDRSKPYHKCGFTSDVGLIKTRLGNDNRTISFDPPQPGPLGGTIGEITIPDRWLKGINFEDIDEPLLAEDIQQTSTQIDFTVCGRPFTYDRFGLQQIKDRN